MLIVIKDGLAINMKNVVDVEVEKTVSFDANYRIVFHMTDGTVRGVYDIPSREEADALFNEIMVNYANHNGVGVYSIVKNSNKYDMFK